MKEGVVDSFSAAMKKSAFEHYVRFKLNNHIVTALIIFNTTVLSVLAFWTWLCNLFGLFDLAILNYIPWWLFIALWILPYVTWHYSTITVPIKDGYKIKRDWSRTVKGRWLAAISNIGTIHLMGWCAASKFILDYYSDYLASIRLDYGLSGILLRDNLDSFILILFISPVVFSLLSAVLQFRDYMIHKDLLKEHFMEWESPFIARYAHQYEPETCDIIVGYELDTKKPIIIKEDKRYLHEAVIGATGSGKTSTTILLRIAQDLVKIASGKKMGLLLLEPKGDAVDDVLTLCKKLGIPNKKIKVIDPTKKISIKYNPFAGDRESTAQSFQGALSALAGDQDPFFKGQQDEAAASFTLLAKIHYGANTNIYTLQQMFTDPRFLADAVEKVRATIKASEHDPTLTPYHKMELGSFEQVVDYFENEVLEYKTFRDRDMIHPVFYPEGHKHAGKQVVENKKDKFVTGAKKYLNDIALNSMLSNLFVNEHGEESFDAEEFLNEGGVILVNTALGELDELSMLFGQFFIRQFQSAVFRRAKIDKEKGIERIPIFFYIDEFPLYANEAFERFLTLGRSYNVGTLIAMQSIAQLDKAVNEGYRKTVLANASNKTVFGRGPKEDNEYFEADFGEHLVIEESSNESGSPITSEKQVWGFRYNAAKKMEPRFSATKIKELPFKQMIVQVVDETNSIAKPKLAIGQFVHESKFIQRFMAITKDEIKSSEERALEIEAALNFEFTDKHSLLPKESEDMLASLGNNHSEIPQKDEYGRDNEYSPDVQSLEPLSPKDFEASTVDELNDFNPSTVDELNDFNLSAVDELNDLNPSTVDELNDLNPSTVDELNDFNPSAVDELNDMYLGALWDYKDSDVSSSIGDIPPNIKDYIPSNPSIAQETVASKKEVSDMAGGVVVVYQEDVDDF